MRCVKNNKQLNGLAMATATGKPNRVENDPDSLMAIDLVGNGHSDYFFPGYTPVAEGETI